jgi:hypothetical protein
VSIISNYLVKFEISESGRALTKALIAILRNLGFCFEKEYAHILSMMSGPMDSLGNDPKG